MKGNETASRFGKEQASMAPQWQEMRFGATTARVRIFDGGARTSTMPVVLYLAGGAFQQAEQRQGDLPVARRLAERGAFVMEADYAGSATNVFPEAMERMFDVLAGLNGCRRKFGGARSPLLIAGEEAGGNIAAGVALKARDQMPGELSGQVLLSPMIDPMMVSGSIRRADEIGMMGRWSDGWSRYLRAACGLFHPYAAPCRCTRLSQVAPALIMTADDDPLRDETLGYADRLLAAGTPVTRHVLPAGSGWAGLYSNDEGPWLDTVADAFSAFVHELKH